MIKLLGFLSLIHLLFTQSDSEGQDIIWNPNLEIKSKYIENMEEEEIQYGEDFIKKFSCYLSAEKQLHNY